MAEKKDENQDDVANETVGDGLYVDKYKDTDNNNALISSMFRSSVEMVFSRIEQLSGSRTPNAEFVRHVKRFEEIDDIDDPVQEKEALRELLRSVDTDKAKFEAAFRQRLIRRDLPSSPIQLRWRNQNSKLPWIGDFFFFFITARHPFLLKTLPRPIPPVWHV